MSEPTLCERCGVEIGAPHIRQPDDCLLPHADHAEAKHGYLCPRHYHWLADTLTQIEQLFALRGLVVLPGSGGGDRVSGGDVEAAAPGRLAVMALTDRRAHQPVTDGDVPDVFGSLDTMVRRVEEESRLPMRPTRELTHGPHCALAPDPTVRLSRYERLTCAHPSCRSTLPLPTPSFAEYLRYLRRMRHWISQQPHVDELAEELRDIHQALGAITGARMWPESLGTCPNCTVGKLYNDPGGVTCRRCGSAWSGVHYLRLRLMLDQAKEGVR